MEQLIYLDQCADKYKHDTWVHLIGKGNYAINQTETSNKNIHHTIYLTRQQLEQILKEEEIKVEGG